jgi:intron-binding protein aquarius
MERARGCFRHLRTLFQELEEIRPFELLKGQGDRVNYLMSKQAKVGDYPRAWLEGPHEPCVGPMHQEVEVNKSVLGRSAVRYIPPLCFRSQIVAMTCTHAALKRREFIDLAFKYDNLLMEEAAQILEIETFIPMLLQVCGCVGGWVWVVDGWVGG